MIRFIYATDNQINDDSVCILRSLSVRYQITSKLRHCSNANIHRRINAGACLAPIFGRVYSLTH